MKRVRIIRLKDVASLAGYLCSLALPFLVLLGLVELNVLSVLVWLYFALSAMAISAVKE